jgi:hypothetical protein
MRLGRKQISEARMRVVVAIRVTFSTPTPVYDNNATKCAVTVSLPCENCLFDHQQIAFSICALCPDSLSTMLDWPPSRFSTGKEKPMTKSVLAFALALISFQSQEPATFSDKLIGSWKLVSAKITTDRGEVRDSWGVNPIGFLTYTADGRMSA